MTEPIALDREALALFARKGLEAGAGAPQVGEGNAVKVRRVLQLTRDLAGPLAGLRIVDLGCGEGAYAIEAAVAGAEVLAIDGRMDRMRQGEEVARRHGLANVTFEQADVRALGPRPAFDVVWCLGLLYHLAEDEIAPFLARLRELCSRVLIVDTLVSAAPGGEHVREHDKGDSAQKMQARVLRSLDREFAFHLDRPSLFGALAAAGFTSALEAHMPAEPGKTADRITLCALGAEPVAVSTYPWVNGLTDEEIAARLRR